MIAEEVFSDVHLIDINVRRWTILFSDFCKNPTSAFMKLSQFFILSPLWCIQWLFVGFNSHSISISLFSFLENGLFKTVFHYESSRSRLRDGDDNVVLMLLTYWYYYSNSLQKYWFHLIMPEEKSVWFLVGTRLHQKFFTWHDKDFFK